MAAVLVCLLPVTAALAATASELFADGNRLFRDDLYWAALLRYREAAEAGMDTPLLHYNMGVAHYRAKQHARARESLQRSATYGPLTPISHYNLGLNAYAMDDIDGALRWFRRARDQQQRRDISRLARQAIRQLQGEIEAAAPVTIEAAAEERQRNLTNLDVRIRVTPVVQSGFYVPISLATKYQVNSLENEGFFGSYRYSGRFYQDKNLQAGDEHLQEVAFGSEYRNRSEDRETRVYSAFKIAQHTEVYYDPDDGLGRDVGGIDISDRMSYLRYGPEFWVRKRMGGITVGARAKGQLWNYEEVQLVPEYDHEYWTVGLNGQYQFTPTSLLRITAAAVG
jgi:tetratricopeptide (TPR) repeat protein